MRTCVLSLTMLLIPGGSHAAQDKAHIPELRIERIDGEISLDGELSEPIWQKAGRIDEWFETSPGDNVSPRVESIGYLAYDDRYLYVGFDFRDPEPGRIRAPLGDRDSLTGNVDHGGILIDTRNDGRTATIFAASARGIQYGRAHRLAGLDPGDAHSLLVTALHRSKPADVADHAVPDLPPRVLVPDAQHHVAPGSRLLGVPIESPS